MKNCPLAPAATAPRRESYQKPTVAPTKILTNVEMYNEESKKFIKAHSTPDAHDKESIQDMMDKTNKKLLQLEFENKLIKERMQANEVSTNERLEKTAKKQCK